MICPKCKKDTTSLVTKSLDATQTERRGIIPTILLFPVTLVRGFWRLLFGRKQHYYKHSYWHCNYCGHDFPADTEPTDDKQ